MSPESATLHAESAAEAEAASRDQVLNLLRVKGQPSPTRVSTVNHIDDKWCLLLTS